MRPTDAPTPVPQARSAIFSPRDEETATLPVAEVSSDLKPTRLQRHRTKGWRMPPGAVYVGRPTVWGNPFRPSDAPDWIIPGWDGTAMPAAGTGRRRTPRERAEWAVAMYREELTHWGLMSDRSYYVSDARWDRENAVIQANGARNMGEAAAVLLRGRDLVCWCPLDQPCHADVLLELAR